MGMCGIIGYIGRRQCAPLLLEGLSKLEYRGYDSAGICIGGKDLKVLKREGKVAELAADAAKTDLSGTIGIAHTRWATHGEPSETNAHPHLDEKKAIAIVHNGIIENNQELRLSLEEEGFRFVSATDSEIFAHLIAKHYHGDLLLAVEQALARVEGSFALAVLHKDEERLVVARKGSPLLLGIGRGEQFVCSDVAGIVAHTNRVVYLEDGDVAALSPDASQVYSGGKPIERSVHTVDWTEEAMGKQGYAHFMLKEINEQPEVLRRIIERWKRLPLPPAERIVITACGTSWHAGLIGKYLIEGLAKIKVEVDYASEFRYRDPIIKRGDLVVVLSQSGETADTLAALEEAKRKGAVTIGLVNVPGSSIARSVDFSVPLHAGPEIGVASTKAFSAQVLSLLLLALDLSPHPVLSRAIRELPAKIGSVLAQSASIRELASTFLSMHNALYLGRGVLFPVALEGALKLKEISYIHAEGYPAAEMKHGPIALIDEEMPTIFLSADSSVYGKVLSNMEEIHARKGRIIAVTTTVDGKLRELSESIIRIPVVAPELAPLVAVVPLQLLAYHIADLKGFDLDRPRNLAKSVTVE